MVVENPRVRVENFRHYLKPVDPHRRLSERTSLSGSSGKVGSPRGPRYYSVYDDYDECESLTYFALCFNDH